LNKKKNILICPLEWGLGHAGRVIPLVIILQKMNNEIFIGAGREHLAFFRRELSGITYIDFPGFSPKYSRIFPQYITLLVKTPLFLFHTIAEHLRLKSIIRKYKIDLVISDNRFGLWNNKIKTVYITHLPVIPLPPRLKSLEWIGILFHRYIIKKYSCCFIPDLPGELNISGRLTHGLKLPSNVRFIGILSRFTYIDQSLIDNGAPPQHYTLILSGPEPQRGILRKKMTSILEKMELPTVVLEGKPVENHELNQSGNIFSYSHLPSPALKRLLLESGCIISRSGYSTIMELISLKSSALLIPTPGQTEQEYLAEYLESKGWFSIVTQKMLKPGLELPEKKIIPSDRIIAESRELLDKALEELLNQ
jgi:spore coat polysaccharide biosynthesis predicted glycosyltransferase SpsG